MKINEVSEDLMFCGSASHIFRALKEKVGSIHTLLS